MNSLSGFVNPPPDLVKSPPDLVNSPVGLINFGDIACFTCIRNFPYPICVLENENKFVIVLHNIFRTADNLNARYQLSFVLLCDVC